jgi:hypothetical protein
MDWLFRTCVSKPFSMILEGFVDSEISECDYKDLCCSIADKLDFCICVTKTITEIRQFHIPDPDSPNGYKNTFSFHIIFPENCGTKKANKKFLEDNMARLLEVCLEDDLPVGLEDKFDSSGKKTFALIKVPA